MMPSTIRVPRAVGASLLAALLLTGACRLSEDRWADQAPSLSCKLLRRCDPIDFYRDFADLDACVDATILGDHQRCEYDEEAARSCREALGWSCRKVGRSYDEVVDRCSAIWICDTGFVDTGRGGLLP